MWWKQECYPHINNVNIGLAKTVIKLFSTGCRRVPSRGFRDQSGVLVGEGRGENRLTSFNFGRVEEQRNTYGKQLQIIQNCNFEK